MSAPSPPRIVGRYALYEPFASGGMAQVHLGRLLGPVGFSRTVAIKRLHPSFAEDPEFVTGFLDEARMASRVRHPNVVTTLDVVADGQDVCLVMEYVQGESLAYFFKLARGTGAPPMPTALAVQTLAGVLHGLHAAHEARGEGGEPLSLVHRDVSPHNILLGTDGLPRVVDFGVAKAMGRMQQTRDGQIKGKIRYMAPEQMSGKGVTRSADLYAASVVLWEALTGRRLFQGETDAEVMYEVMTGEIPPPSSVAPDLPPALDAIVLRGLRRDPAARFETAAAMALALEQAVAPLPASALGRWVQENAQAVLGQRSSLVERIERDTPDVWSSPSLSSPFPSGKGPSAGAAVLVADTSAVSGKTWPGSRVRAPLGRVVAVAAAAGLLLGGGALFLVRAAHPEAAARAPSLVPAPDRSAVAAPSAPAPAASAESEPAAPPLPAPLAPPMASASAPPVMPRPPAAGPAPTLRPLGSSHAAGGKGKLEVSDKDLVR